MDMAMTTIMGVLWWVGVLVVPMTIRMGSVVPGMRVDRVSSGREALREEVGGW